VKKIAYLEKKKKSYTFRSSVLVYLENEKKKKMNWANQYTYTEKKILIFFIFFFSSSNDDENDIWNQFVQVKD
jgi:hypothetical protein